MRNDDLIRSSPVSESSSATKHVGSTIAALSLNGEQGTNDDDEDGMSVVSSLSGTSEHPSDICSYGVEGLMRLNRSCRLYGRTKELNVLLEAFTRVRNGSSEVVLVAGEAGSGKSKVAESLRDPVTSTEVGGHFVAGKYDQLRLNESFSAISDAFNKLAEIMSVTDYSESKRNDMNEYLGADSALLCNLVPSLSIFLGQTTRQQQEGENMMNSTAKLTMAFRKFLDIVATKASPLCIFLDDIQWADQASMQVIRCLITNIESKYVLLVLAYRNDNSNVEHVEKIFRNSYDERMMNMTKISIGNLDVRSIHELICDQLEMTNDESVALSQCIWEKTLGNPFFVLEFLDQLIFRGYMVLSNSSWFIDMERIQAETSVSSNIVSTLTEKMLQLHPHVRAVLTYAAYLGFQFRRDVLETIVTSEHTSTCPLLHFSEVSSDGVMGHISGNQKRKNIGKILEAATEEGIVEKCDDAGIKMQFVHDYPQTILYDSVPEGKERAMIHLRIGMQIRESMLPKSNDFLPAVVHHLNHASACLVEVGDLVDLARLNLDAAKLAKCEKSAFLSALNYLQFGIHLLDPETMWNDHYELCLELHSLAAEIGYCIGNFEFSNKMIQVVLVNGRTIEDKASVYYSEINSLKSQAMALQSIDKGVSILQELGAEVKRQPTMFTIFGEIVKTKRLLHGKSDNFILSLPLLEGDARVIMITTILYRLMSAAYQVGEANLFVIIILRLLQLSIQQGVSYMSPAVIAACGALGSKLGKAYSPYRFGMLSLKMLHRLKAHKTTCETLLISWSFDLYWRKSLIEAPEQLMHAHSVGEAQANMDFSFLAACNYIMVSYFCGKKLQNLESECKILCDKMHTFKQEHALQLAMQFWWAILSLTGSDLEYYPLLVQHESATNDALIAKRAMSANSAFLLAICRLSKLVTAFHCGFLATAEDTIVAIEKVRNPLQLHWGFLVYKFYSGLTFYALASTSRKWRHTGSYRQKGDKIRRLMIKLSNKECPSASLFLAHLDAERNALISKDANEVVKVYEHAMHVSANQGFVNYEGLANERAFLALNALGFDSQPYFDRAIECYVNWGANHKVQILKAKFAKHG